MIGGGPDGRDRIGLVRSLAMGGVSFALTGLLILITGMQGSSLIG
jgi:hypothetical protein